MCACINRKHVFPFIVQAFSKIDEFMSCSVANQVELLLVDESMYDDVKNTPAGQIIRLCEQPMLMEGGKDACVAKFQASDSIIRDVLYLYSGQIASECRGRDMERAKIVCVYSPNGCCGKTTLAMALAHLKGKDKRTLYISFEEFSAMDVPPDCGTLSDALYYYQTMGASGGAKLLSVIGNEWDFDYIPPTLCAKDIARMDADILMGFIDKLADIGEYELVVVDMGSLIKEPWVLLNQADIILSPEPGFEHQKRKQEEFEKYMYMSGYESTMEKLIKVELAHDGELYRDGKLNFPYIKGSSLAKAVMDIDV